MNCAGRVGAAATRNRLASVVANRIAARAPGNSASIRRASVASVIGNGVCEAIRRRISLCAADRGALDASVASGGGGVASRPDLPSRTASLFQGAPAANAASS